MAQAVHLNTLTSARTGTPQGKTLVVSRCFAPDPGGIQDYAYNRCLHDPDRLIVLTATTSSLDRRFDQAQAFPIHRWPVPKDLRRFFSQTGAIGSILKQGYYLIAEFISSLQLYARYRYRYIEWCHGYDFPVVLLLSYLLPVQVFIYLHGDDLLCPLRNPVLRLLFEWTLNRSQGIACNSQFTRDYLTENFQVDVPIHILHPMIRPEKLGGQRVLDSATELRQTIRDRYRIPATAVVILTVGRLVRRKGFNRVIDNLPQLQAAGLDVYHLICGRGPMETELRTQARRLGVEHRVLFAGYVADDELASYYAACDIFAMPTFFDVDARSIEGFGIVYLEAGYFGKPVLASRVGGVVDAVQHESSGLLVNPNSDAEVSQALLRLCQDAELRDRLGRNGQVRSTRQTFWRALYGELAEA